MILIDYVAFQYLSEIGEKYFKEKLKYLLVLMPTFIEILNHTTSPIILFIFNEKIRRKFNGIFLKEKTKVKCVTTIALRNTQNNII